MRTLLVCLDFSDQTDRLVCEAQVLARGGFDRVVLLHVAGPNPDFIGYDTDPDALRDQMARVYRHEAQTLHDYANSLGKSLSGIEILPLLVPGASGDKILEHARRLPAAMILMGTHGHGGLYELLIGSTSQFVLKHTRTPLLLIPTVKTS